MKDKVVYKRKGKWSQTNITIKRELYERLKTKFPGINMSKTCSNFLENLITNGEKDDD